MTVPVLELKDVTKTYRVGQGFMKPKATLTAVGGVSLTVARGEVHAPGRDGEGLPQHRLEIALVEHVERLGVVDLLHADDVGARRRDRQRRHLPHVVGRHRLEGHARQLVIAAVLDGVAAHEPARPRHPADRRRGGDFAAGARCPAG